MKKQDQNPNRDDQHLSVVVKDLERRFGDFWAVKDLSFEVPSGQVFGFLGPNGAGKSTTIRMLCGLLSPTGGSGTVAGFDIRTQAEKIKSYIGYMSQRFSLYEDLTVEENINFYSGIYRLAKEKKKARLEWVIEMAGLKRHRHSRTAFLSGGWKQRLALGCAILHEPPIIFLDEPTSGVDPISRRQFWDLIYELSSQGITVFVTTHYMDEAEYCDRVGLIYRGELIALGTPHFLKTELMPGEVLEVLCQQPQEAMIELEKLSVVKEAAMFGQGIHLTVKEADQAIPSIQNLLAGQDQSGFSIKKIIPSLEDVFVALIEERDRAEAPQGEFKA